jgi:uncharacterized protein
VSSALTDRLRGIVRATPPATPSILPIDERHATTADDEARVGSGARREAPTGPTPHGLETVLGGSWVETGTTRSFIVDRREDSDRCHGRVRVGALAESLHDAEAGAALLTSGDAAARPPFVFFDLETTGLSGGAGTYAFLVGCGWFDAEGGFAMRQYVLPRGSDERSMLRAVAEQLSRAGTLVSFNGKSFDAPLLETRFSYHRLPWPAGRLPHLDVLHPARRFWRADPAVGEASSCSLGSLELQVLGAHRQNDLPGSEAPGRYFQFVRSGDARPLAGVLEHNRNDLLSLAGLTVRLLRLVRAGAGEARDAREAVALGRLYERAGFLERAEEALVHSLTLTGRGGRSRAGGGSAHAATALRAEALHALALLARRGKRHDVAAARWREILDVPGCPRAIQYEALEALAVHHEHRERDLVSARLFALQTLGTGPVAARHDATRHRLARLERKLGMSQAHVRLQLGD